MQTIKIIFFTTIALVICFTLFNYCSKDEVVIKEPAPDLYRIYKDNEVVILEHQVKCLLTKVDSLKNLKQTKKPDYLTRVDSIIVLAPDTCTPYINALVKEHAHIDKINDLIIAGQDSVISKQASLIANRNSVIAHQDTIIKSNYDQLTELNKSLQKANKKAKRNFWAGFGIGGLLGGAGAGLIQR